MARSLDGKAALVTGASSGIGRAVATALAREGADLTLLARREDRLVSIANELGVAHEVDAQAAPTDVRDPDQVATAVDGALDRHGRLDVAISNAGTGVFGDVDEVELEEFHATVETNVNGTFYLTRAVLPALRAAEGNLVFVGSFAGQYPFPGGPVYAGSKAWIRLFAHSVEARAGADGVAVTVINPGGVRPPFAVGEDATQVDRYDEGEAPEPTEIADAVVFACQRSKAATVHELNIYRRDQLADFG